VAIGLRCKDGVVLAVEKVQTSKLLVKGANKRIVSVDNHVGLVSVDENDGSMRPLFARKMEV
jgi:20S proteasome subunit alpha 7